MNLRDARLPYSEHDPDLFHGQFFVVIKGQHLPLFFRKIGNGAGQQFLHFRAQAKQERRLLGIIGQVFAEILLLAVARRSHTQTAHFEAMDFSQQQLQAAQVHVQFDRQLGLRGIAAEFGTQLAVCFFEAPRLAPQIARAPVHFPQAVENRAADAKLGVRAETVPACRDRICAARRSTRLRPHAPDPREADRSSALHLHWQIEKVTVSQDDTTGSEGGTPSRQPAGRRRYGGSLEGLARIQQDSHGAVVHQFNLHRFLEAAGLAA